MAVAGSAQPSIYLELNGRKLFEGAIMGRQSGVICDDAAEAWEALTMAGACYMRLLGSNLPDVRALYATWLEQVKAEEEG